MRRPAAPPPSPTSSTRGLVEFFAALRWRLFRGALAAGGAEKAGAVLGAAAAVVVGLAVAVALLTAGQALDGDDRRTLLVLAPVTITVVVVALGVIVGISQPIDPRVLATEPLTDRQLATGLLAATAAGPAGLAGGLVGFGLYGGALRNLAGIIPSVLAVAAFLGTLLLASRSTINALGLLVTRRPRLGQALVGVTSLAFYAGFQFVPDWLADLPNDERQQLADRLELTPPGQLGAALAVASTSPGQALVHVALGAFWLAPLGWVYVTSTRRLLVSTRRMDAGGGGRRRRWGATPLVRRACGSGARGAVAWRGLLTRLRTPRSALETFIGAGIGMAVVLVPALTRDEVGAGAVLVGGALQIAVVFIAGNSFGSDGPALGAELLCGVDPRVLVEAKARSIVVVASPLVVVGPLIGAAVTGEWDYLPAGFLVAGGGLLAGVGGAIVQSTFVPVAVPESDNPLASGDSGRGLLGVLVLGVVLAVLALATLPIALALLWATTRRSVGWTSVFGAATLVAGWAMMRAGIGIATGRWRRGEPELYDAVVPAR